MSSRERFKVSACIAEHIGDRKEQQDRVAILTSPRNPGVLLAVLADGMGGRTGGRMASDQVIATADALFQDLSRRDADLRAMIQQMASEAHTVIRLSAISSEKEPHATMVALLLDRERALWGHAGDSRLYFVRNGTLVHRTEDHTYGAKLRAEGQIARADEADIKYKNILANALGMEAAPRIEFAEERDLQVGDTFLMCSDGLWAYFEDQEITNTLYLLSPRDACTRLVNQARERARRVGDNLSLAIVKLEAAPGAHPQRGAALHLEPMSSDPTRS